MADRPVTGGSRWWPRAALAALGVAAVLAAWEGGRAALADALTLRARWQIDQWHAGGRIDVAAWIDARESLRSGLGLAPDNPQLNDYLAQLYDLRGAAIRPVDADLAAAFFGQGLEYHRVVVRLRPMSPHAWAGVALAGHYGGGPEIEMWTAFDRALAYGPNEPAVQRGLAEIACARWRSATPERQQAVREFVTRAPAPQRQALVEIARRHQVTDLAAAGG